MIERSRCAIGTLLALLASLGFLVGLHADDRSKTEVNKSNKPDEPTAAIAAIKPKPLSGHVKSGLAYLISQQHKDGGWGQGGGWRTGDQGGRVEGGAVEDPSD